MGTRISCKGWTLNVDESVEEVKALLDDGQPHVLVPWSLYRGGQEIAPEPVVVTVSDGLMLADDTA